MLHLARGKHRSERDSWNSLRLFLLYRIGVYALLFTLFILDPGHESLGKIDPLVFGLAALGGLSVNLCHTFLIFTRRGCFRCHVHMMMIIDIVLYTIMLHSSGGLTSGLGMLLIASVAGTSLLLPGKKAPFFAAIATLAILLEQSYTFLNDSYTEPSAGLAAIHGVLLFIIALLAASLARRALTSEALANQQAENLANLAALNEHIVDRLQSGVLVIGDDRRIRLGNQSGLFLFDTLQIRANTTLSDLSPALAQRYDQWKQDGKNTSYDFVAEQSGREVEVRFISVGSGAQTATLVFLEDVSERTRQLQEIKLASLGRLTASIAHEIRNPLGAISHASELLCESESLDTGDARLAEIVRKNARRMNTLIEDILNLSRGQRANVTEVELSHWLQQIVGEYQAQRSEAETVPILMELKPQQAQVDTNQLHQVIWNLISNAQKYAQPEHDNLQLSIKLEDTADSRYAQIDVIDNGGPLPESTERHLFEPFFTTGVKGTGLGLYIARELVRNNGGKLSFLRLANGGNCFRIHLPTGQLPTAS